ncbi:MAG: hypothetical protein DWH73_00615 [Planctomycetota bacterium]|nr:MAG: hypothetical protein DWH73_00615 [Planctomycetota bacterium]
MIVWLLCRIGKRTRRLTKIRFQPFYVKSSSGREGGLGNSAPGHCRGPSITTPQIKALPCGLPARLALEISLLKNIDKQSGHREDNTYSCPRSGSHFCLANRLHHPLCTGFYKK